MLDEPGICSDAGERIGQAGGAASTLVEGSRMSPLNSTTPLARRAALAGRLEQLERMIEIRVVEDRIQRLFSEGEVRGSTHLCSGQEAVSVGIARATRPDDIVCCTYRGHGHALALGLAPEQVIGEICGRSIAAPAGSAARCIWWSPRSA